jgi:hypothetical protein
MIQPAAVACPAYGQETHSAKCRPEWGTKIARTPVGACPNCGAQTGHAKFCPAWGAKLG